jgi:DNA-directed RNA polymerase sigma subunit (sigma70/sigma32)
VEEEHVNDESIIEAYERGDRTADIVAEVGSQRLYKVLRQHGVKMRRGGWECEPDERQRDREQAMFDMRTSGATLKEIAKAHSVTHQRVAQILGAGSGRGRGRIKGRKST